MAKSLWGLVFWQALYRRICQKTYKNQAHFNTNTQENKNLAILTGKCIHANCTTKVLCPVLTRKSDSGEKHYMQQY